MEISFALVPALIHVYIFVLESLLWGRKRTNKTFGISEADAKVTKGMAFNQGFYNLFLAVAILVGLHLRTGEVTRAAGTTLVLYGLVSILAAGLVLLLSAPKLWRAAMVQIAPAAIAIVPFLV